MAVFTKEDVVSAPILIEGVLSEFGIGLEMKLELDGLGLNDQQLAAVEDRAQELFQANQAKVNDVAQKAQMAFGSMYSPLRTLPTRQVRVFFQINNKNNK